MHAIRIDTIHKLAELRITGTPGVDDIAAAGMEMRRAVRTLSDKPDVHLSLYDLSEMGLVRDEVISDAFAQWADPRFSCVRARKVALIAPSALARLKLDRLRASRPGLAIFADRAEAMRWLFAA